MENQKTPVQPVKRWSKLFIGAFVLLFGGVIYAWSILKEPFSAEFHWDSAQLGLNYTITISAFCIGSMVAGILSKKMSSRIRMIFGAICALAGFGITSSLSSSNLMGLYLGYGILAGGGTGFTYNTVVSATNAWYPDKKGLCSGILMMVFGFSAFLLGKLARSFMISPAIGWRKTYLILAIASGGVLLAASFFVRPPSEDVGALLNTGITKEKNKMVADYTTGEIIKQKSFWLLFLFFLLMISVGSVAIAFAKDLFVTIGAGPELAITMAGILSTCNGLGRLASGATFDRYGSRVTQRVLCITAIVATCLVLLALKIGSTPIGITGLCLCGFTYGFCPTLTSTFCLEFYGTKNFPLNFSVLSSNLIPGAFAATAAGIIYKRAGSFAPVFILLTVFSTVALVISFLIRKA